MPDAGVELLPSHDLPGALRPADELDQLDEEPDLSGFDPFRWASAGSLVTTRSALIDSSIVTAWFRSRPAGHLLYAEVFT